ncbi:MAG: ABC transporter permease [Actinobacteria bacterium]|nr:ABC transporter permease [Actinomycetota bacterium]
MKNGLKNKIYPIVFFAAVLGTWEIISAAGIFAAYILPAPVAILISLFSDFKNIGRHSLITLYETFTGFFIAVFLSVIVALIMDAVVTVKKTLYPVIIISQTIPIIVLAPLFIIWFGYGYLPKIIIVILICFFPVTVSFLQGLSTADRELVDLMRSMGADKYSIYRFVKIPSAMPAFFSGLKIAATYSIMGATIGEWVGGKSGLGVYMIRAKHSFATDKVFAAILVITVLSIIFLKIIELAERKYMPWLYMPEDFYIEEK